MQCMTQEKVPLLTARHLEAPAQWVQGVACHSHTSHLLIFPQNQRPQRKASFQRTKALATPGNPGLSTDFPAILAVLLTFFFPSMQCPGS